MLTIGKPNNQQNKFSLGKETPCRGFLNHTKLRRARFLLCFFFLLQTFLFLVFLTPLLKLRHFFLIVEKLGDDRCIHTHDLQNLVLGDLGSTAIASHFVIKSKTLPSFDGSVKMSHNYVIQRSQNTLFLCPVVEVLSLLYTLNS